MFWLCGRWRNVKWFSFPLQKLHFVYYFTCYTICLSYGKMQSLFETKTITAILFPSNLFVFHFNSDTPAVCSEYFQVYVTIKTTPETTEYCPAPETTLGFHFVQAPVVSVILSAVSCSLMYFLMIASFSQYDIGISSLYVLNFEPKNISCSFYHSGKFFCYMLLISPA